MCIIRVARTWEIIMTIRGFLMWYLGAVTLVGATGASSWQALQRLHAANTPKPTPPAMVAEAPEPAPPPLAATTPPALRVDPAPVPAPAASLPKLRIPPLPPALTAKATTPERKRTAIAK